MIEKSSVRARTDDESNWVTTSMARNSAKLNWTLEEIGWSLQPPGDFREWDGLVHWFLEYTAANHDVRTNTTARQWRRAAELAVASGQTDRFSGPAAPAAER